MCLASGEFLEKGEGGGCSGIGGKDGLVGGGEGFGEGQVHTMVEAIEELSWEEACEGVVKHVEGIERLSVSDIGDEVGSVDGGFRVRDVWVSCWDVAAVDWGV